MTILLDDDYNNIETLKKGFIEIMSQVKDETKPIVAIGIAKHEKEETFDDVFRRADELMYQNKKELKKLLV